jgi:hypothetical protein
MYASGSALAAALPRLAGWREARTNSLLPRRFAKAEGALVRFEDAVDALERARAGGSASGSQAGSFPVSTFRLRIVIHWLFWVCAT